MRTKIFHWANSQNKELADYLDQLEKEGYHIQDVIITNTHTGGPNAYNKVVRVIIITIHSHDIRKHLDHSAY